MIEESSRIKFKEHIVVQKFEGDPEEGRLVETVTLEDGKIISQEFHNVNEGEDR